MAEPTGISSRSAALVAAALGLAASALAGMEVDRRYQAFEASGARVLRLDLALGDVAGRPHPRPLLDAELVLHCAGALVPCREAADDLELESRIDGEVQVVAFAGAERTEGSGRRGLVSRSTSSRTGPDGTTSTTTRERLHGGKTGWQLTADVNLSLPPTERLEVLVGEGSVELPEIQGSTRVRLGKGIAQLGFHRSQIGSVTVRIGKGMAILDVAGERIRKGRKLEWRGGTGDAAVELEIDKGTARVTVR